LVIALLVTVLCTTTGATAQPPEDPEDLVAHLVDVRVAGHGTYDRVVFEFDGPLPERIDEGFVTPPIVFDPSGEEVVIAGAAFYGLVFFPARTVRFVEEPPGFVETYLGPDRVTGDTKIVTEAVLTGDFEATLGWTIGMTTKVTPTVTTLADPTRVVVDVPYPAPPTTTAAPTTTAKAPPTPAQPTYTG
jgi:hypothetical protein